MNRHVGSCDYFQSDGRRACNCEVARLRDAAPELLEALKAMVASYDGIRDAVTSDVILSKLAAADAAIARAEGR